MGTRARTISLGLTALAVLSLLALGTVSTRADWIEGLIAHWCFDPCEDAQGSSDCCAAHGTPGCEDPTCAASVCSYDPYCCEVEWDGICANEAATDPDCNCGAAAVVVPDCSGHGNDGQNSGATCVAGACGQALEILGTDIVWGIPFTMDDPIVSSQALTISVFVNWYGANEYGRASMVFDARNYGNPCLGGFALAIDQDGKAYMNLYNPPRTVVSPDPVHAGWTHVAATFDAAAQSLRIFIDGREKNSTTTTGSYQNTALNPAIGNNLFAPGDYQWAPLNGNVDELRIYDHVLSPSEMCQLYSNCASPTLVGDLNCDGAVNFGDINPFVQYLSDFVAWQGAYCCPARNGDINGDGSYGQGSFADINPFVALLSGTK